MKELVKLVNNSSGIQKFNIGIAILGMLSSLLSKDFGASILWVLVLIQDIYIIDLQQFSEHLIKSNLTILSSLIKDNKEEKNE